MTAPASPPSLADAASLPLLDPRERIVTLPQEPIGEPIEAGTSSILVIDDSTFNLKALSMILKRSGYGVLTADGGEGGLEVAAAEQPDLILLDVRMPGKNGFEVCAELKANPATAEIPVIFLSAVDEVNDRIKALDLGAADFVGKAFAESEVLARVRTQLRMSQLTRHLTSLNQELVQKQEQLEKDLQAAGQIQQALLPSANLHFSNFELAWRFEPCGSVGGDIFNVIPMDDDRLALYVLDVSGHGVPSSLVAVSVAQSLASLLAERVDGRHLRPGEVLQRLDEEYPIERFERTFTINLMILDAGSGRVDYSSAGHPPPILIHEDAELEELTAGGPLIGLGALEPFEEGSFELREGDRLFLYTDGIVEHVDRHGEMFGVTRLHELVQEHNDLELEEVCNVITAELRCHNGGGEARDDISIIATEFSSCEEENDEA